ncbi:MAG TPA: patatin-like phospholipase family protein [Terriglobales bacterium]|nr:patatin-like phospholipase family protein [Terriglobales bacterium]
MSATGTLDPLEATKLEDTTGLSLSGGGFRAMVFHVGALWRLNELGMLPKISRYSSVSGGSITNGVLARAWSSLTFDPNGIASNFAAEVASPILAFAQTNVDIKAILIGLLPTQSVGKRVSNAYDEGLFHGTTLQNLPTSPRFTFNTTNLMSGSLMRFSPEYASDYRVGRIDRPDFLLADIVAASSAFPPVLSPFDLNFGAQNPIPEPGATLNKPPYTQKAVLSDGGIYDNLGLETVWKRCKTLLVSNAGRNVFAEESPAHFWPTQLYRAVNVIHNQVDNARERQLLALAKGGFRNVAYWAIETEPGAFHVEPSVLSLSKAELAQSASISTRLAALTKIQCSLLLKHAYLLCDLSVRSYFDRTMQPPPSFPHFPV